MKTTFLIIGGIIVGVALFAIGYSTGSHHGIQHFDSSFLKREIGSSASALVVVEFLDEGRIEDAKSQLNLQLDGRILGMDMAISANPHNEDSLVAQKLLFRIAHQRELHPVIPSSDYAKWEHPLVRQKINEALSRARAALGNHNEQNNPAHATGKPAPGR